MDQMDEAIKQPQTDAAIKRLQGVAQELLRQGKDDLANEVGGALALLRPVGVPEPSGGVMTTGAAAAALGVRSVNTVKRWVGEGLLEGFRRGGRILVSRRSVERMLRSPQVAEQRTREARLAADLGPFDVGGGEPPTTEWTGRRPWEENANTRR